MATKKEKKVDIKDTKKAEIMGIITEALTGAGIEVLDGEGFGFTKHTIVARTAETDIQIKPITPKAGITKYESEDEEKTEEKAE